jgi:signal transduction histidine kinase
LVIPLFTIAFIGALTNGGFRILFGLNIEHKDAFVINSFVLNGHVDPDISDENLKELFYQLKKENYTGFLKAFAYSLPVMAPSVFVAVINKASFHDVAIVLFGGLFGGVLLGLFTFFSAGKFTSVFLHECREIMKARGMNPDEKIKLFTLKGTFYYFVLLFIMMIAMVLSFVEKLTPLIIGLVIVNFVMVTIVIRILFSYIVSVFEEIEDFSKKLPHGEKIEYFTGSSYEEVLDLSKDLTESAAKIYDARIMEKKAREELAELDESKTQFILATEHHLRTPLTISKGYLDSFLEKKGGTLDEEGKSYLNKVKVATARVTDLVNELLEISQMEVGKSIIKLESVNIRDLIMDIMNNSKFDIDVKKIKSVFYFPEENNVLSLNKEKITEALSNLISNAVKYNKMEGELKVSGKIITNEENKKFYQLTIEDQGIGIKPENISKIFTQYFERGEEARKVYATGRGIGLVISKNIVKAHQGVIRAESEGEGKGSRFIIELPVGVN